MPYTLTKKLFDKIINLIWPPRSLMSDEIIEVSGTIEYEYWKNLKFNYGNNCYVCAIPLIDAPSPKTICASCMIEPPEYDNLRSPLIYDENSKQLVLAFKHGGRKDGLEFFTNIMKEAMDFEESIDLIIPVPIHFTRLFSRGYNQSAWLAKSLSKEINIPWSHDSLIRHRRTKTQNELSIKGRYRNVSGAFKASASVKNKNIVLIDDVYTTGATINACAKALKKAGASKVYVISLMRVNKPH